VPTPEPRTLPHLDAKDLDQIKAFFPLPKFFIFGHARSGTTLLARLVRLHPEVHCNWQAHFFTRDPTIYSLVSRSEIREWLQRHSNRWNQGEDLSPLVIRVAADFIMEREARALGKTIVGDKSPNSLLDGTSVKLLHGVYPDGKLLYIVRDGRDTILSHRFQSFIDFPEFLRDIDLQIRDDFTRNPEPFFEGRRSLFTEDKLRKDAGDWVRNVKETNQFGMELFGDRFYTLRYEDLISDPVPYLSEIWAFLGVKDRRLSLQSEIEEEMNRNPDAAWQETQNQEMISNLQKGTSGTWEVLFTERDCQIFKEIAGEALIEWGYEEDEEW
jgi:LPS sulfotransferase NodH